MGNNQKPRYWDYNVNPELLRQLNKMDRRYGTAYLIECGVLKTMPKRYSFPDNKLEQPKRERMETAAETSSLYALLKQLMEDGHDISGPYREYMAMCTAMRRCSHLLGNALGELEVRP
jgi:hypothetical protein